MRIKDPALFQALDTKLSTFTSLYNLPGINSTVKKDCLIHQIIDSDRRIKVAQHIGSKAYNHIVADPSRASFNPLAAASYHFQNGDIDEAIWLVFLAIHFGKNKNHGWNLARLTYSGLGNSVMWDWQSISNNPSLFRSWLTPNYKSLKLKGKFSNHRRYTSLKDKGTGRTFESYVHWIGPSRSHNDFLQEAIKLSSNNPRELFSHLYKSMGDVLYFGRLGKFDFLTMLGKLGIVNIEPDSTYIKGATGPYDGAKLLFGVSDKTTLNNNLNALEAHLGLYFGMQILEDSLCNWQKNPLKYTHFRG